MLVHSLRHMTTAKLAIILPSDPEICVLQRKHRLPLYLLPEEKWEHLIRQKLPPSSYPIELQREITAVFRAISFEIQEWFSDHKDFLNHKFKKHIIFYWKSDGTINRLLTAYHLIHHKNLDLETRFVLACQYWCWSDIYTFWKSIPASKKHSIRKKYKKAYSNGSLQKNVFSFFKLLSKASDAAFRSCTTWSSVLIWNNLSFFNNVFNALRPDKRLFVSCKILANYIHIPLGTLCLSRMSAEEQKRVLHQYPYQVLRVYLHWPLQTLFVDSASEVQGHLPEESFLCLIHIMICQKILPGWRDSNYVDLLRTFWRESPQRHKDYAKDKDIFDVLKTILDGKRLHSSLRNDEFRRYLVHGETVLENANQCASISNSHTAD